MNNRHELSGDSDIYSDYWLHSGEYTFTGVRTEPTICLVYSGELVVECDGETISAGKGDCLFLKGGLTTNMKQKNVGHDKFCGIFIEFDHSFLMEFYHNRRIRKYSNKKSIPYNMMKLQNKPCIRSLYVSMIPFLESGEKPPTYLLELKRMEAVFSLLNMNKNIYPCVFEMNDTSLMTLLNKNNICKN